MPSKSREDVTALLRLALAGFDAEIADMQEKRAQLSAMIGGQSAAPAMKGAAPRKKRKLSVARRAKLSAAAKARWAREKKGQVKASKAKPIAKKAPAKVKPTPAKPKKSPAKKGRSKPVVPAASVETEKAA